MMGGRWKCEQAFCEYTTNDLEDLDKHREVEHPRAAKRRRKLLEEAENDV